MPKPPLSKAELYQLAAVVALGAAVGFIWQTLAELTDARRQLRTTRLDLAAARGALEDAQADAQRLADVTASRVEDAT